MFDNVSQQNQTFNRWIYYIFWRFQTIFKILNKSVGWTSDHFFKFTIGRRKIEISYCEILLANIIAKTQNAKANFIIEVENLLTLCPSDTVRPTQKNYKDSSTQ